MAKQAKKTARRARPKKPVKPVARSRVQRRSAPSPTRTTSRKATRRPAVSARQVKQAAQQVSRPTSTVKPQAPLGTFIGEIDHYFTHLSVGILEVHGISIQVGDKIRIKGATTDFVQTVQSMQLDHQPVQRADKGKSVGIKVAQHVREHDKVYRL